MDTEEIKKQIKGLPWRSRRRIHHRCFEEALGSWRFSTAFVAGIPAMILTAIWLSKLDGIVGDYNVLIVTTAYGALLSAILERQGARYLEEAYKEFQQNNRRVSPEAAPGASPDEPSM